MKQLTFSSLLVLSIIFSMSFVTNPITPADLLGTKWISPINDNCFDSLCFTSERNVMYYRCDWNVYAEVGYKINGDKIEIGAHTNESKDPVGQLILVLDNGVLKQPLSQNNDYPKNFIKVPYGACED